MRAAFLTFFRGKKGRWLLAILLLVLAGRLLAIWWLDPLIARSLQEAVDQQTKGRYRLETVEVDLSFLTGTVRLHEIRLRADSSRLSLAPNRPAGLMLDLHIPDMEVKIADAWAFFFNNRLHLEAVHIRQPEVSLAFRPGNRTGSEVETPVYELLDGLLSELDIDEVKVTNGTFLYNDDQLFSRNTFTASDLSLTLTDFHLDTTDRYHLGHPFSVGEIKLEVDVNDYTYLLPDSSYEIKAARLGISTRFSGLYAEQVRLRPNYRRQREARGRGEAPPALFEVSIPRLQLSGIDVHEMYANRVLRMGSLRLTDPYIVQVGQTRKNPLQRDQLRAEALLQSLQPYFKALYLEGLSVERGSYRRIAQPGKNSEELVLEGLGAYLSQLSLDSAAVARNPRHLSLATVELKADGYSLLLDQDRYRLQGGFISYSSFGQRCYLQDLSVRPRFPDASHRLQALDLPGGEVTGLDLGALWFERKLRLDSLALRKPDIRLLLPAQPTANATDSLGRPLWALQLQGIFAELRIGGIGLEGGRLRLSWGEGGPRQPLQLEGLQFHTHQLRLAGQVTAVHPLPFRAASFRLQGQTRHFSYQLPDSSYEVSFSQLQFDTRSGWLAADSLNLRPLGATDTAAQFSAFVPRLKLQGIDLARWYRSRQLWMESLEVTQPDLRWWQPTASPDSLALPEQWHLYLPEGIQGLRIEQVALRQGKFRRWQPELQWAVPDWSLFATGLRIDAGVQFWTPGRVGFARQWDLEIRDWAQHLPGSGHRFDLARLRLSSLGGLVHLDSLHFWPDSQLHEGLRLQGHLPLVQASGLDWEGGLNRRDWIWDRLQLTRPQVRVLSRPADTKAPSPMPKLRSLGWETVVVLGASLDLAPNLLNTSDTLSVSQLTALLEGCRFQPGAERPWESGRWQLSLKTGPLQFANADSSYLIRTSSLAYSSPQQAFSLANLHLQPQLEHPAIKQAKLVADVFVPHLQLEGLAPQALRQLEGVVNLKKLSAQGADIRLHIQSGDSSQAPGKLSLPPWQIDQVQLSGSRWDLRVMGPKPWQHVVSEASLSLRNFAPDSLPLIRPDRILYAQEAELRLTDWHIPVDDSIFTLYVPLLTARFPQGSLRADSLQLLPNYQVESFVLKHGYMRDIITAKTDFVQLEGIDAYRLWRDHYLHVSHGQVQGLNMNVRKNRRFPEKPNKAPPTPHEVYQRLPFDLQLDSLEIRAGRVEYRERVQSMDKIGYYLLTNLEGLITQPEPDTVKMWASANMMGKYPLAADFVYAIRDPEQFYRYHARAGRMDLRDFNPLIEPAAETRVESGIAYQAEAWVEADATHSTGKMYFWYDSLKVEMINEKGIFEPQVERRGLMSVLANLFVVKTSNPGRKYLRVGRIAYKHEQNKGFIAHWVNSITEGLKSSVGIKGKEEKDKSQSWFHRFREAWSEEEKGPAPPVDRWVD